MWAVVWGLSWLAALAFIYFNCTGGTSVGYISHICTNGFGIIDVIGLICCAPIYLVVIVLLSLGSKII